MYGKCLDNCTYKATLYCGRWWPVSRQNVLTRSIIHHFPCLKRVYFAVNIGNLLVQQVDSISNKISTFIFHSILYFYVFWFNIDSNSFLTYLFCSLTKTSILFFKVNLPFFLILKCLKIRAIKLLIFRKLCPVPIEVRIAQFC